MAPMRRRTKESKWPGAGLLAAGLLAFFLAAGTGRGREPETIRRLRPETEPKTAARIEMWRGRLDETFQGRYNFAWCLAQVEGLARREYIAHSSVDGPEDLTEEAWNLVRGVLSPGVPEESAAPRVFPPETWGVPR